MDVDTLDQDRREYVRWLALTAMYHNRPQMAGEGLILSILQGVPVLETARGLRRELVYLRDKGLIKVEGREGRPWSATLTPDGVDVVEYTVACPAGIARPPKYWEVQIR